MVDCNSSKVPEPFTEKKIEKIDPLEKENPLSLYNCVSPLIQEAVDRIPADVWERVEEKNYLPTSSLDLRMKINLWDILKKGKPEKPIVPSDLIKGIATYGAVYSLLKNPERLAYILIPPKNYHSTLEAAQDLWLTRIFEILEIPIYDIDPKTAAKKLNVAAAQLVLKAATMVDLRKHGNPTQRIEQKSLNVNIDETKMQLTPDEIDKKLKELEDSSLSPKPKEALEAEYTTLEP